MTAVILQPSYIPWRGYFHQIRKADVFVFYDDVQYDTDGWRNRNRIKTATGPVWLTIPVRTKGVHSRATPIREVRVADSKWQTKHWRSIEQSYAKAPYFGRYAAALSPFWLDRPVDKLADYTIDLTVAVAGLLGISGTRFLRSSDLPAAGAKTDRLVSLLAAVGGVTRYVSGPSAREYIEADKFSAAGIELEYMTYGYPPYSQLHGPFEPQVSVLDLLFMTGPNADRYIWGHPEEPA